MVLNDITFMFTSQHRILASCSGIEDSRLQFFKLEWNTRVMGLIASQTHILIKYHTGQMHERDRRSGRRGSEISYLITDREAAGRKSPLVFLQVHVCLDRAINSDRR